jgi:hypothetical protein
MLEDVGLKLLLDGVGKFHSCVREEFHAVVLERIVGSGDYDACLKVILTNQAGYSGRGDDSGESHRSVGLGKTRCQKSGDVRAGFARVHADEDVRGAMLALKIRAEGAAGSIESGIIQGRSSGNAANAIGAKKFFAHAKKTVSLKIVAAASFLAGNP